MSPLVRLMRSDEKEPLLRASFWINPRDFDEDYAVDLVVKPLDCFYDQVFLFQTT